MMEEILKVKNIKKYYELSSSGREKKYVHALDDVSLSIYKGEIFGVVGESGSGKSTFGRCILRLEDITDGEIYFNQKRIDNIKGNELKTLRKDMQMIFQNPYASFNPKKTLGSSIRELAKVYKIDKNKFEIKLSKLMEKANMPKDALNRTPGELSGGQLQRFAIVRALILNPQFIIADEAVSALDVSVQAQILNMFLDMKDKLGLTILFISHDLNVVERICDRVVVIYLGKIVEMANVEQIYSNTLHPYTQALINSKPRKHPDEKKQVKVLEGDIPNAVNIKNRCRLFERCKYRIEKVCDACEPPLIEYEKGHFVACHKYANK